ncbi:MAG: hypothetical protein R6U98_28180, partial [Pirellulaceae bacterium]
LSVMLLVLVFQSALHADDSPKDKLPVATEPDARLQADGKGWRLDRAKVTDTNRNANRTTDAYKPR